MLNNLIVVIILQKYRCIKSLHIMLYPHIYYMSIISYLSLGKNNKKKNQNSSKIFPGEKN